MKKEFLIVLESYPESQREVCEAIENYCVSHSSALKFESRKRPVLFSLDRCLYTYEMVMSAGKYCIKCIEI